MQRRAATFLPLLAAGLALASASAPAIDPGTVRGHLQVGAERHDLSHVQAVRVPGQPKRLWILLTTAELSVREAADPAAVAALAAAGGLRGVRLVVDAAKPDPRKLEGTLLLSREDAPGGEIAFGAAGERLWERLSAGQNRVGGMLRYGREAGAGGAPAWTLDASFSAPVFSSR